jgi:molybdopterin molybdotransferase
MLTWDEAKSCVLARTPVLSRRRVRLEAAPGRILAEPLIARNDSPPFDMSAVDGFAVHPRDVAVASECRPVCLQLTGTIHAGDSVKTCLRSGNAIKILTGACVPQGAGAIVMKEYCQEAPAAVMVCRTVRAGENIRPCGGEFRKGQNVLPPGVPITPPVAGLLAAFGYASVFVYEQPAVTIVVTGDELLSPSQKLRPGKIRDANSYALVAAVQALGIEKYRVTRLKDRPVVLKRHLADALKRSDMLLVVGGMSVGDHDYNRTILRELGIKEHFWRMAVKPGKPAYFGLFDRLGGVRASCSRFRRRRPCIVFGLPGNPVSALVCFHQLVKPALLRMMGMSPVAPLTLRARLAGERRKQPGRLEWLRGILSCHEGGVRVEPTSGQDSHMLGGLARANCLIQFPQAADCLADGTEVIVEPLSWRE